jgi:hypothetical protein
MMCKTRTKIISAFEQKGSRTKGYHKTEQSNIYQALLKWLQWKRSDMDSEPSTVKSLPDSSLVQKHTMMKFSLFSSAMPRKCQESIAI